MSTILSGFNQDICKIIRNVHSGLHNSLKWPMRIFDSWKIVTVNISTVLWQIIVRIYNKKIDGWKSKTKIL